MKHAPKPNLACIILAGGASSRMGSDKRRLRLWGVNGPTLLEHMLSLAIAWAAEPIIVLNDPQDWGDLPAQLVADPIPGAGPLAGLVAGLAAMHATRALVLACDMPCVQVELLDRLACYSTEYDAVVPQQELHGVLHSEPLLALYHQRCLPIAEALLACGERRMTTLLERLHVCYLPPAEWQLADPTGSSFRNLNRPDDLARLV